MPDAIPASFKLIVSRIVLARDGHAILLDAEIITSAIISNGIDNLVFKVPKINNPNVCPSRPENRRVGAPIRSTNEPKIGLKIS